MKLSDKILSVFLITIVIMAGFVMFSVWRAMTSETDIPMEVRGVQEDSVAYWGEPFSFLSISGQWNVSVHPADSHGVEFTRDDDSPAKVQVYARNDTLFLVSSTMSVMPEGIRMKIESPRITQIQAQGAGEIHVNNFTLDTLRVESTGGVQFTIDNCTIENFSCAAQGFSDIKARTSLIKNADLEMQGAYGIELTVNNGILSGSALGMGGLEIYGSVKEKDLNVGKMVQLTMHGSLEDK